MSRSPSILGVILAAGESSRMGRDKALLPWPPIADGTGGAVRSFLSCTIELLKQHTEMVLVVTGSNSDLLAPTIYSQGAFLVENTAPELGQFSSLKAGLQSVLQYGRDAAMVALVDRPPVLESTVMRLHAAFLEGLEHGMWATVPEFGGQHGHPIVLAREMMELLLRAPLTTTARDVMHANADHIVYVPVEDPLVAANINTPDDYARLGASFR
ncbi:MAG TPA: nucleotidyltransferase family protein [Clostridia bacterium]|nr:nucleotidyltransferase family protein [Clostridia bacterium]